MAAFYIALAGLVLFFYYLVFRNLFSLDRKKLAAAVAAILLFSFFSPYVSNEIQIVLALGLSLTISAFLGSSLELRERDHFIFIALSFSIVFAAISCARYLAGNNGMVDIGNMLQPIYNTGQGRFMQFSKFGEQVNRFSMHQEFIYLLFVPLVRLFRSGCTLLIVQSFLIGFSSVAIYKIAFLKSGDRARSSLFGAMFLLYPPLLHAGMFEFHGDTLAVFFICYALYFYFSGKKALFFTFTILSFLCKEYIALLFIFFSIYMFVSGSRKSGIILFILGIFYYFGFLRIIGLLIPRSDFIKDVYYTFDLKALVGNVLNIFKIKNFLFLFVPLLFISLLEPLLLLPVLPVAAGLFLSDIPEAADIRYHHWASVLPFIYSAFVLAACGKDRIKKSFRQVFVFVTVFSFLTGGYAFSFRFWHPAEYNFFGNENTFRITRGDLDILRYLRRFSDPGLKITTTPCLGSLLAARSEINILSWNSKAAISSSDLVIFSHYEQNPDPERHKRVLRDMEYVRTCGDFRRICLYPLRVYEKAK